jgi:hypothetical protein
MAEETYNLPAPLGMALATDRPEFVNLYLKELTAGGESHAPQFETVLEILRLVRDMIADRFELKRKLDERDDELEYVADLLPGLKRVVEVIEGVHTDLKRREEEG